MNHKKKILVLALATIFVSLLALGSAAYFTVEGRATNVITTGTVSMSLDEHLTEGQWEEVREDNVVVAYKMNDLIMPGVTVEKTPTVSNDGTQPFFLRVKLAVDVSSAEGEPLSNEYVQLLQFIEENWGSKTEPDGWLYYSGVVAPGDEVVIFDGVKLAEATPNDYQSSTVTITVQAQAVQVKNNPGDTALTAEGWPAEADAPDTEPSPEPSVEPSPEPSVEPSAEPSTTPEGGEV